jgi:hypothetical protein
MAGLVAGPVAGLGVGLVVGLVFSVVNWVGTPSKIGWANSPRSTYKAARALTIIQICVGGLVGGPVVGLGVSLGVDALAGELVGKLGIWLQDGVVLGLESGLTLGLVGGLGLMSSGAWLSYVLASWRLAAVGKLPLRLIDFLDDAYRLGLLRTTGPAYQFRHAEFQDHLLQHGKHRKKDRV